MVTVLIAISLAWSFREIYITNWNENLVDKIHRTAFERIALRDDYLLNREERAAIQWQIKSADLRKLLETAEDRFSATEDKRLLHEARKNFDATFITFSAIIERSKHEARRANSRVIFDEAGTRQIGQVFLKSYALMDSVTRLHESTRREVEKAQNMALLLIIIFFAGGGIAVVVNSNTINNILAKRLTTLATGIKAIGEGKLDYKIPVIGNDELSELAVINNEMAAKLKKNYTSIENLQKEINGRKQAQEEIKILNTELEQRVAQRTADLTTKTTELEKINKVFVDRELRMRELKERIAELEEKT